MRTWLNNVDIFKLFPTDFQPQQSIQSLSDYKYYSIKRSKTYTGKHTTHYISSLDFFPVVFKTSDCFLLFSFSSFSLSESSSSEPSNSSKKDS